MQIVDKGVDAYIQERIKANDKKWGLVCILMAIVFIGGYLTKDNDTQRNLSAFKIEKLKECQSFQDSLVNYCNEEYNIESRCKKRSY